MIYKGSYSNIESYSAFFDNCKLRETQLRAELQRYGVTDVYLCGLALDVCVGTYVQPSCYTHEFGRRDYQSTH